MLAAVTPLAGGVAGSVYRVDVQQGNLLDEEDVDAVHKAAERGTAIHDAIERGFGGALLEGDEALHYSGAMKAVEDLFGYQPWISEKSFACKLGYGGRVDLHCPTAVVVFKTTEKPLETIKTWPNHAQQLAAYAYGLGLPLCGAICYFSVTHPGESVCIPISEKELQKGWDCFKALLSYWQAKNDYDSSWEWYE